MTTHQNAVSVFLSYAYEDELLLRELEAHLSLLQRQGLISTWHDRQVLPGTDRTQTIDSYLENASLILLLVSADFLASDYCYNVQMQRALQRHEANKVYVIPIILRPCDWSHAPFAKLIRLPRNGQPITMWENRDAAWNDVTGGIRRILDELSLPATSTPHHNAPAKEPENVVSSKKENGARGHEPSKPHFRVLGGYSQVSDHQWANMGEAPAIAVFYGREQEIATIEQWMIGERCHIVALSGIGGIGKTSLARVVIEQTKRNFTYLFWRSLYNAPYIEGILRDCIQFVSDNQHADLPEDIDSQITLLIKYLQERRCLLVLDNFESVLQGGTQAGQYRLQYEAYGRLLQRIGTAQHQSCLLLTSRERPKEIALLQGDIAFVQSLQLTGLGQSEAQAILKDKGLFGGDEVYANLTQFYSGNPLALKLISEPIRELFGGDISEFLSEFFKEGETAMGDIQVLLEQQFKRLSELEREIMYWLAIEREPIPSNELRKNIVHSLSKKKLLESLESLHRRSMIETRGVGLFTLQPVVMEYVISELIAHICEEINTATIGLLASHTLIKAQIKDYIRNSQERLILLPIVDQLLTSSGQTEIEAKLKQLLTISREHYSQTPNYIAGNILNLLLHFSYDLRNYDFSHQMIQQAYLKGVNLQGVNFAYSHLAESLFTETFDGIISVALSPRGEQLAAGTASGEVRIWQTSGGTPLMTCSGHTDWVRSVAFSHDEAILASGSEDYTVRLWKVSTGRCLQVLQGHTNRVRSVAFSPDGEIIASGSEDKTIRLWEVSTGRCLHVLQGHASQVWLVTFHLNGTVLISMSDDRTVYLWEVSTGRALNTLQGQTHWMQLVPSDLGESATTVQSHSNQAKSIALSFDKTIFVEGSEDQTVRLWEVSTGRCLQILRGHTNWIWSVAFSPDGEIIASGSEDKTIRLWEVSTGRCLQTLQGHTSRIRSVTFSPDGNTLASGSEDQAVRLWEISTGHCLQALQGYTSLVRSVAFSPLGNIIATDSEDRGIRLWQIDTGHLIKNLKGHDGQVRSVAFSPDGKIVVSGSDDQTVRLWDAATGRPLKSFSGHSHWVRSVAFSPDGKFVASGSDDWTIRLWEISSDRCLQVLRGHTNLVWSVAFSPDGKTLASASHDQTVRLWEISTGSCLRTLQGHNNWIWSVAFSPDGKTLASGSEDRTIRLWECSTGDSLQTLQGHTNLVWSVAFSPDGKTLASASHDQTVRLWEISTGRCLYTLRGHNHWVRAVAFHPSDNTILASGGHDGTIKLWDTQIGLCLKTLRSNRPYENMNIAQVKGLTESQKETLRILGAVENE